MAGNETEAGYLAARDAAWARYHAVTGAASLAYQRGEISASQLMVMRDAAHAELDDTLTAARVAAGYQRPACGFCGDSPATTTTASGGHPACVVCAGEWAIRTMPDD